jgi:glycosyltransferase involved in cell wall biosynthesis
LKVLQLIDSLSAGGAERMAVNIANAFSENSIESTLCVTRKGGILNSFLEKDVNHYVLNKRSVVDVFAFSKLLRIIARHKPDIIHAHSSSYFWAVLAKFLFPRLMIIWHDHQGLREKAKRNHRPLLKFLSRKIDGIIVVNEMLKDWNIKYTHVPEERIIFINNFPDPRIKTHQKRDADDVKILCLANLRPEKNHPMLIRAFRRVAKELPGFKMHLLLAGNVTDAVQVKAVTNLINQLKLDDNITLLGTVQNTSELLSQVNIGVLSSTTEGLPVSLLEYGMAELPVVVTNVGQCKEVVQGGKCGWVVESRDEDGFAKALSHIIRHPSDAAEKAYNLKERISSIYGAKHFVFEYVSFAASIYPENKILAQ